jgi:hypothetical protein
MWKGWREKGSTTLNASRRTHIVIQQRHTAIVYTWFIDESIESTKNDSTGGGKIKRPKARIEESVTDERLGSRDGFWGSFVIIDRPNIYTKAKKIAMCCTSTRQACDWSEISGGVRGVTGQANTSYRIGSNTVMLKAVLSLLHVWIERLLMKHGETEWQTFSAAASASGSSAIGSSTLAAVEAGAGASAC